MFVISFNINDTNRRDAIVDHIKSVWPSWARIADNVWLIKARKMLAKNVRDNICEHVKIENTERLIVFNVTDAAWASYNLPKEISLFIKED